MFNDDLSHPSSQAIHFASEEEAAVMREPLRRTSTLYEIGEVIDSRAELFRLLASTMSFPEHFGHNWDAVVDCLRDLEPAPHRGVVLMIRHAKPFWGKHPECGGELIEVWLAVAEEWRERKVPFHLLFVW